MTLTVPCLTLRGQRAKNRRDHRRFRAQSGTSFPSSNWTMGAKSMLVRVALMLDYRCYFLDAEGHIRTRREFEARDDAEGILLARALYAVYAECAVSHHGFELWQRSRRLVVEKVETTPEPSSTSSVTESDSSNFARVSPPPPRL